LVTATPASSKAAAFAIEVARFDSRSEFMRIIQVTGGPILAHEPRAFAEKLAPEHAARATDWQSAFDADIGGTSYRLQLFLYDIDGMDELDPCVAFVRYLDHGAVGGYFCSTVTTHGVLAGALDKGIL
jgi:hypothetical protein